MKVLIVRVGAMGDVIHALPAVAALRQARPEWEIDWVVDPRWAPLLVSGDESDADRRGAVVDGVHLAPTKLWKGEPWSWATMRSVAGLRRAMRARKYDLVVDMQGTLRSAVIGKLTGGKEFFGYADPRERSAARFYRSKVERTGRHVVEQGAGLLSQACGVQLEPVAVTLPREELAESWAEAQAVQRRPMCCLGAGGGWGAKQWPAEKFGKLAVKLCESGFDVVVNAPRKDNAEAMAVVEASGGAARMVVCDVTGLVALLRRTDLFVGGDTGPTHLAAALAVPVVALFGPTDPARNGPWGPGLVRVIRHAESETSYKRVEEIDHGLSQVTVDEVLAAALGLR